jgi:hypothetical protein
MLASKNFLAARLGLIACFAGTVLAAGSWAVACPFCSAVQQTLRQEMAAMDAVVIAEAIEGTTRDEETGEVPLKVVRVLKGDSMVKVGTVVRTVYYGSVDPGRRFMLSGVEPSQLMWSSPLPVDERSEQYLAKLLQLPDDELQRLRFYQEYLEDPSPMLARDAYDEFAITPYPVLLKLKPDMDHDQLVQWIKDPEMSAERRRLYLVMLGVCGSEKDVPMLDSMLRSSQKSARAGLDSLVACYLTLAGQEGLKTIDELFLENKQAPYADTYAAIMALRFHGTESDKIPRAALVKSLHHVLERTDLADLVIPDLARWGDWTVIDRLVELFRSADADNNWVRVPVVNYMRACPLPEATEAMETLKSIDPEAVKRANTFFAEPIAPAEKSPSTSALEPTDRFGKIAIDAGGLSKTSPSKTSRAAVGEKRVAARSTGAPSTGALATSALATGALATRLAGPVASANSIVPTAIPASVPGLVTPNLSSILCVLASVAGSLMITAYLVISGGPQPQLSVIRNRLDR